MIHLQIEFGLALRSLQDHKRGSHPLPGRSRSIPKYSVTDAIVWMIDFLVNLACTNLEVAISLTFAQEYSFGGSGSAKHWDRCFRHHHHFHYLDSSCRLPLYAWCCCLRCRPILEFIPLILIHCCLFILANLIYGFPLRMAEQYWVAFPLREFAPLRQEPVAFWFASNRSQILLNCYQAWSTYQHSA